MTSNKKNRQKPVLSTLDKVLFLLKKYWYIFLISILTAMVIVLSFSGNAKIVNLLSTIMNMRNSFKKQVDIIDNLSDTKTKQNSKAVKQHSDNVIKLETKRDAGVKKAEEEKDAEIKVLSSKTSAELAKDLKDTFKL